MADSDQASTPDSPQDRTGKNGPEHIRHDINSELFLIRGYADMIGNPEVCPTPEKARELAAHIETSVDRLKALVNQLPAGGSAPDKPTEKP
ncbi:MAG: histidine kinase dimerization/phospho-acceptor domain-containing protein [Opitutales bacterium]